MAAAGKPCRPGYSFLVCPDSGLILQYMDNLIQSHTPSGGKWARHVFWGDEPPSSGFWESLRQQSLFAEYKAVIVRRANEWPAAVWKSLSPILAHGNEMVWPVFCLEVDFEKGHFKIPAHIQKSQCMLFAEKQKWVWTKKSLNDAEMRRYVADAAQKKGLRMAPDAIDLFCASVKPVSSAINNEIEKLALLSADGNVSAAMISTDSSEPENNAFNCIRLLESGDLSGVWREISRAADSSLLFFLIALLAKEFRAFWKIQSGENVYLHPSEASLKRALAQRMGRAGAANGFALLADAEWQVKSGRQTPEQALETLIIQMAEIFRAKPKLP